MNYYRYKSTGVVQSESEVRAAHRNMSLPRTLNLAACEALNIDPVFNSPPPTPSGPNKIAVMDGAVQDAGGNWMHAWKEVDVYAPAPVDSKAQRHAQLLVELDETLEAITAGYSEREVATWPQQQKEAEKFAADSNAPTPLLDAMAAASGRTKEDLATQILAVTVPLAQAVGTALGAMFAAQAAIDAE